MPGIDVKVATYGERGRGPQLAQDRYNSEDSLEDNQSTTSSTESRQSDFQKKDHEFIPTRSSGILASKPAYNPAQFTRVNSNPLLISAQKQLLLVEEVRKKKKEVKVGDETPEWQSNLDSWKHRRRKQSEEALSRVTEIRRIEEQEEMENGMGKRKVSIGKKISLMVEQDDEIDIFDLPPAQDSAAKFTQEAHIAEEGEDDEQGSTSHLVNNEQILSETSSARHTGSHARYSGSQAHKSGSQSSRAGPRETVENPYETAIEGYKLSMSCTEEWIQTEDTSEETPEERQTWALQTERRSEERQAWTQQTERRSEERQTWAQQRSDRQTWSQSQQSEKGGHAEQEKEQERRGSNSTSSSISPPGGSGSSSHLKVAGPLPVPPPLYQREDSSNSKEEEWESKIESCVQPARKASTELSDKMRLKLASFEDAKGVEAVSSSSPRLIEPDNTFRDKLKAFKSIETSATTVTAAVGSVGGGVAAMNRRESEPALSRPPGYRAFRSTSSSALMNTIQNNKFFQQNSLSSEGETSLDDQLLDDALEESFSKLEEKDKPVFRAEDLVPSTERLAPPSEKPPPLPPVPPPELDEEESLVQQEREIIESLEQEERNRSNKTDLKVNTSPTKPIIPSQNPPHTSAHTKIPHFATQPAPSYSPVLPQSSPTIHTHTQYSQTTHSVASQAKPSSTAAILDKNGGKTSHSRSSSVLHEEGLVAGNLHLKKPSEPVKLEARPSLPRLPPVGGSTNLSEQEAQGRRRSEPQKDYNKHWLIQEAEQRRISEAQQRLEKIENINNNLQAPAHHVNNNLQASAHPVNNNLQAPTHHINNTLAPSQPTAHHSPALNNNRVPADRILHKPVLELAQPGYRETKEPVPSNLAGHGGPNHGVVANHVSENIYANVDPTLLNFTRSSGYVAPLPGMQMPPEKGAPPGRGPGGVGGPQVPPRGGDGPDRVLSVSGKKKCSACKEELGRGAAMIIESLRLFYHIRCFKCCVCSVQLGNGEQGTDVRVRNNRLHCQNCYSNDEGLKFSKV